MASRVSYVKVLQNISKVLGRQVSKAEGDPGLIMSFKVLEGHSK